MHDSFRRLPAAALVLVLASSSTPAVAQCSFAWDELLTQTGTENYTTGVKTQPYQGPCMAFAFVAAMESMFEIEHADPLLTPNLSEAWLDYRTWGQSDWKGILEHHQIPVPEEACGNFPPLCKDERTCNLYGAVRPYVESGDCFDISREFNEHIHELEYVVQGASNSGIAWYRAGSVDDELNVPDTGALKEYIRDRGPVVLRIDEPANIAKFRNYNTTGVHYHALAVIGWQDIGTCTRWLVKDSWPGMAGIAYTKTDPGIPAMMASGDIRAWQVSDISYQPYTGGPILPAGTSWPNFDPSAQCVPPPALAGNLNCWDYGADRGGCMQASNPTNGISVSWQLFGSGGSLTNTTGICTEIIGTGFSGTLKGTATDGCGRTVTATCSFTGNLGGPQ